MIGRLMPSFDSTELQDPVPARAIRRGLALAMIVLLACAGKIGLAQEPATEEEDLTVGLASLETHLKRGKEFFADLKFPEAIAEFDQVVQVYDEGKLQDGGESTLRSVAEALDLRARAHFNQGDRERARNDFVKLLHVQIDYQIDRRMVSPKVIELYEQVRKENVGTLSLSTDPPGAEVYLNDEQISRTPVSGRAVIGGTYKLRLVLKGFEEHQEDLILTPRSELKRDIKLTPNRRILQFITEPSAVNVLIDGTVAGTTFGTLPPELQSLAKDAGLDPARASAPLLIQNVEPGEHQIRFEKECFEPQPRTIQVSLDLEKNSPQIFQPVALKQEVGTIRVTSHPSGAEVFVDGKSQGTTPLQQAVVCAGDRDIRLAKQGEGVWFDKVRIKPDVTNLLDATLRPTLLYLGTFRLDEWGRLNWSDRDKLLLEGMKTLRSVNQVRSDDTLKSLRDNLVAELQQPTEAEKLRKGAGLPAARVLDCLGKLQADLLLVGISVSEQGGKGTESLFLYSSEQPEPDMVKLDLEKPAEVQDFLARFDRNQELTRPWVGAAFTDTLLGEGPVVVRVVKSGPADQAGLLAGDQVLSVNAKKVSEAKTLQVGTAGWKEKDHLSIAIRRDAATQSLNLVVEATPVLIPMYAPDRLYNKALCDYRQLARGADEPLQRALAQVNLGLAFMHFRAYAKALSESFNVVALPARGGISRGTVRYYQGLCYLKKDLIPEARTAFQEAAASPEATLESNDGPPVAARAKNLLQ
jgi:tetratricopeptide (TPR) repeat protein